MSFNLNTNVYVTKDDGGVVRALEHLQQPFRSETGLAQTNPSRLGEDYLRSVAAIYGFPNSWISNLNSPISDVPTDDGLRLAFAEEKSPHQASIISYYQTVLGLPIWESGFSVTVLPGPLRGTSSISSVNYAVKVDKPSTKGHLFKGIEPGHLQSYLSLRDGNSRVRINSTRLLVYQYNPSNRQEGGDETPNGPSLTSGGGPTLPLPPVSETIK